MARPRPALPERRDRRPARVPRPRPQPALPGLDGRADGPGHARRLAPIAHPLPRSPDRDPDRRRSRATRRWRSRPLAVADSLLNIPRRPAPTRRAWRSRYRLEIVADPARGRAVAGGRRPGRRSWSSSACRAARSMSSLRTNEGGRPRPQPDSSASRRSGSASSTGARAAAGVTAANRSSRPPSASSHSTPPSRAGGRSIRRRRPVAASSGSCSSSCCSSPSSSTGCGSRPASRREEQPGHGADDQRRLAAPDADRQGRRDRGGRADPVPRDRRPALARSSRSRIGSPRPSSGRAGPRARRSSACRRRCSPATASSSCSGSSLFALIYAAMGSFVSRPDDLQTLSLPLSLLAMVGYLTAIVALGGGGGRVGHARLVPAAVQPVRDARAADGLGGRAVGGRAVDRAAGGGDRGRGRGRDAGCTRPGVLLYGQRPGIARLRRGGARARWATAGRVARLSRSSSGSRLIRARTGARPRPAPATSASLGAVEPSRARHRRPVPPPRTATAGSGRRAGTGSTAAGRGSRRCPGRRPPRTARSLGRDRRHGHDLVARPQDAPQRLAPPDERLRQQRAAVEVQQVEGEERRRPPGLARPAAAPARPGPPARPRRPRPARRRGSPSARRPGRPGPASSGRTLVRSRPSASTIRTAPVPGSVGRADHHERPLAAPPRLEQVLVRVERRRQRAREHRPQVREIGQLVGLEAQRELVGHRALDGSPLDFGRPDRSEEPPCRAPPRPDDLYRLRIATEPRLSPDGRLAVVTLQTVAPGFDGYRQALWLVPTDGSTAAAPADARRQARPPSALLAGRPDARLPLGSPDARRGGADRSAGNDAGTARPREDARPGPPPAARRRRGPPADRPAARRRGLRLVARRHAPGRRQRLARRDPRGGRPPPRASSARRSPGAPPPSDYRFIDRLDYMLNGAGFTYDRVAHLWLVDVGDRRRPAA